MLLPASRTIVTMVSTESLNHFVLSTNTPAPTMQKQIEWTVFDSEHGTALAARHGEKICWLSLIDDVEAGRQELSSQLSKLFEVPVDALKEVPVAEARWTEKLQQVIAGALPIDAVDVHWAGTAFQVSVWQELRKIPAGETRTYQQIADALNKPTAARAVGTAIGQNHIAVLIPCHRVVRSDGHLAGFRWGTERKRALLAQESAQQVLFLV